MDSAAEADSRPLRPSKPLGSLGRDEMNLAEFPITLLTDRVPKDQREAVYQDEIYDERSGLTLTRKLTIQAGNCGLTTAIDDQVILALIQLTKNKNTFTERKVEFSRYELANLLGWSLGGASYERIKTSLDRWTSVYLQYENAWRDNRTKTWRTIGFHIIDKYELNDTRHSGEQLDLLPSHIVWNEVIFESFQAGYLKPLDYNLCMGLSNSTAKRMYRFLDKRFHHKPEWTFDLKELAHEHIGLGRHYEGPAHLKRNLQPAIEELEAIGFLEPLPDSQRFQKDGKSWRIRLIQKGGQSPALAASLQPALPLAVPEPSPLEAALIGHGFDATQAADLARQHDAEHIKTMIEYLEYEMARKPGKIDNPAAWLFTAIKAGRSKPKGFTSRAEREQQAEAGRQRQQAEDQKRRREKEQAAREKEADDYIKQLAPAERARLEAEAVEQASPEDRQSYDSPHMAPFLDTLRTILLRQHVMKTKFSQREPADA